jgi:osmotically-inducible protein OsmY
MIAHARNAVFVALAATGGFLASAFADDPAMSDRQAQSVIDASREARIATTFALSPYLRMHRLAVSVAGSHAVLSGIVGGHPGRALAGQLALDVDGIESVDNRIRVDARAPAGVDAVSGGHAARVDDAGITLLVRSKFEWNRRTNGSALGVATSAGRVELTGTMPTINARATAGRLAANTAGVSGVDNRIHVQPMGPEPWPAAIGMPDDDEVMGDGWITASLSMTYRYSASVQADDIVVSTRDGVVTLVGDAHGGAARALAIELARELRGVRGVDASALML